MLLYLQTQNIIYDDLEVIAFYLHFNAKTVIGQDAEKQFTYILYMFCSKHQNQKKKKKPESIRNVEEFLCGYYTHKMCAFELCFWTDMFCLTVSFEIA